LKTGRYEGGCPGSFSQHEEIIRGFDQ